MKIKFLIILLFISSCSKTQEKEKVEEFVLFGYRGFCIKDSTKGILDSTKLDIREYFEFKNGDVKVAARNWDKKTEYHLIKSSDTLGLDSLFNLVLKNHWIKKKYDRISQFMIYDGGFYTMYFNTSWNREFEIDYMPYYLPTKFKKLHEYIRNIIRQENPIMANKFEFNKIVWEKSADIYKNHSRPIYKQQVKFSPPKIKPDEN